MALIKRSIFGDPQQGQDQGPMGIYAPPATLEGLDAEMQPSPLPGFDMGIGMDLGMGEGTLLQPHAPGLEMGYEDGGFQVPEPVMGMENDKGFGPAPDDPLAPDQPVIGVDPLPPDVPVGPFETVGGEDEGESGEGEGDPNAPFQGGAGNPAPGGAPDTGGGTIDFRGEDLTPDIDAAFQSLMNPNPMTPVSGALSDQILRMLSPEGQQAEMDRRLGDVSDRYRIAQEGMIDNAQSILADRGLISWPGAPQGTETNAIGRITSDVARQMGLAMGDVITDEHRMADQRISTALSSALGYDSNTIQRMLGGATNASQRQGMLGNLALQALGQNMQWNMFLAQHGLDRERLMYDIQNGRINQLMGLLQQFGNLSNIARGGYV